MTRLNKIPHILTLLTVVAVILVAGGAAIASNAGFKFNTPLDPQCVTPPGPAGCGSGVNGQNVRSLPYFNPYHYYQDLCDAVGIVFPASIRIFPTPDNVVQITNCGTPAALTRLLAVNPANPSQDVRMEAYDIVIPDGAGPGGITPDHAIIVGSHDPQAQASVPTLVGVTGSSSGNLWWSVPYHTTAESLDDVCIQLGLNRLPPGGTDTTAGTILTFDAGVGISGGGTTQTWTCGTLSAQGRALVLGEGLQIRNGSGCPAACAPAFSFTPAHF